MENSNKRGFWSRFISILCVIITVVLVPILICNLVLIIKGLIDKETVPSVFGFSPLVVQTDSMVPTFSGGDLIIVQKCDVSRLEKDDIISFYEPTVENHSVVVTHRIVGVVDNDDGSRLFRTQGDANNTPDSVFISQNDVVGKYLFHIEGLGSVINYITTTEGMLLFIVLPMCLLFGLNYFARTIEAKKQRK